MSPGLTDKGNITSFARYIGIDYSGAQTPRSSLRGLRVYMAEGDGLPIEAHFWPFDGWEVHVGRSTVAEVYLVVWKAINAILLIIIGGC